VSGRTGVLVMAHGTPASLEEVEPFYTRIRRGSPPSPEQLADLVRRYEAIGGVSPLAERTAAQVVGLANRLDELEPGRYVVAYGAKHTDPSIEAAASELARRDVEAIVGIVLTPHRSSRGSGEYLARAGEAIDAAHRGLAFIRVEQWFDARGIPELLARRVEAALASVLDDPVVIFTAHSVPVSTEGTDPYEEQVVQSAELVAKAAGLAGPSAPWCVAFQSAGRTNQQWLGPALSSRIDELAADGRRAVVVCPIGFVSDHLEILYDLDIEARARAEAAGLAFARTASLNDDPAFVGALADVVAGQRG